jgi:hypothetical protein
MTFLHATFLAGTLAVAVPIVLHLVMRKQPQRLEFPALRFIKQRESINRRQVKLRHWLLLALRCAVIVLLAVALARPSIVASSGVLGDQEAPVAAALVFDTNPRMQYRQQNQTRLEVAQQTGEWLLAQLPRESDVAIVDSSTGTAVFAVDPGAARQRIERLDATRMTQPLPRAIEAAVDLLANSPRERKELYVFTDLSQDAWSAEATRGLAARLAEQQGLGVYLIDVGVREPMNVGLAETRLSGEVVSRNAPLSIHSDVVHTGVAGDRTIELYLVDPKQGTPELRGRQILELAEGNSTRASFQLRGLPIGLHQGYLQLAGQDALACDDQHWFSVEVRPAWRVLLAAPQDGDRTPAEYGLFLAEAIAPYAIRAKGEAGYEVEIVNLDTLAAKDLAPYSAVCLVDPKPLDAAVWQKLHGFVSAGGGLGIFLGANASPVQSFNEPMPQQLLPGRLVRQWRSDGDVYLAPDNYQHPVMSKFAGLEVAWPLLPVFRHWQFDRLADGASIVVAYSNNQPALVERPIGKGRVLTMTTPISDPASKSNARNYVPWNLLPTGDDKFPFYLLANTLSNYLVGGGDQHLNYLAGGAAVVRIAPDDRQPMYLLTTPRGDQIRTTPSAEQDSVVVTSTETPGNYRLTAGGGDEQVTLGFSVNLPPGVSNLDRAGESELQAAFGDTPYRLARNREEVDRSISAGRVGQELFPYLIVLLVLVLAGEQVLANRFYQDYDTAPTVSHAAELAQSAGSSSTRSPVSAK